MRQNFKLAVEGWRGISHSYAVVNQWQLLALLKRPGIDLRVKDLPFSDPNWRQQSGLFSEQNEHALRQIKLVQPDFCPDATWRIAFPYDLGPAPAGKTLVFGTAEYRVVPRAYIAPNSVVAEALANPSVTITTPSRWSAEGFRRLGFDDARIAVVPHGIDPLLFRPRPEKREVTRKNLGLSGFVFMSAGAMTTNKGMDLLLRAFAAVAERHAHVRLLLKGADKLYPSRQFLQQTFSSIPPSQAARIVQRLVYGGDALSMDQMSDLYQAADAYVSPYRAEGFNMPVLEAAACGVPVICTRGGSTDDFTTAGFALKIDSSLRPFSFHGESGDVLEPDLDHLTELMISIVEDEPFRAGAAVKGPRHASENFSWDAVIDRMIPVLSS